MLAVSGFPRGSRKLLETLVSLKLRLVNAGAKRWMQQTVGTQNDSKSWQWRQRRRKPA